MAYAILRTAKLKNFGNIGGSLAHNYRTRETLNADEQRSHLNKHELATAEEVKQAIQNRLPEKVRSNGVLCIEYFIGASPEYFTESGDIDGSQYFETARKWLENKHGKENVITTSVHLDETSPHLVAYVVPIDQDTGRLNARKFLGGRATLSAMQTDFANTVKHHGLDRGIEGSKATHTTIQEYYANINRFEPKPEITASKPKWYETSNMYAERLQSEIKNQLSPKFTELSAKAARTELAEKEAKEAKETALDYKDRYQPIIDALYPLEQADRQRLADALKVESIKILEEKERQKQAQIEAKKAQQERKKAEKIANTQRKRLFSKARTLKSKAQGL